MGKEGRKCSEMMITTLGSAFAPGFSLPADSGNIINLQRLRLQGHWCGSVRGERKQAEQDQAMAIKAPCKSEVLLS